MNAKAYRRFAAVLFGSGWLLAATWLGVTGAGRAATVPVSAAQTGTGAVVINEAAWMGTAADYNDEWIELYNTTGMAITLAGWSLSADDGTPAIPLDGVLPAHGYFLLERTDDTAVSDIPADQIYTGALENDPNAESLRLTDGDGTLIDVVNADGGTWPAGDNSTKHTMERIDPLAPGEDENWATNNGLVHNGHDAAGLPLDGTPKARNSVHAASQGESADLAVDKRGPATALPGERITYTLSLSNAGPLTATAVYLTDPLPADLIFLTQVSPFAFTRRENLLSWALGDLAPGGPGAIITLTARISVATPGTLRNVISATTGTTETIRDNNRATWETQLVTPGESAPLLINALLFDGYQTNDRDEAVQLINTGGHTVDLAGYKICDAPLGGTCATLPGGALAPGDAVWLAYWASAFYTSSGVLPAYAVTGLAPGVTALNGTWPRYANTGEAVVLCNGTNEVLDVLVYGDGDVNVWGWNGAALRPWQNDGLFGVEGQILYRKPDEGTDLPIPDTDRAADWAQDPDDPLAGRRVRYPGWDLETFFHPLNGQESAHITVAVAPDNGTDLVTSAILSARHQIEIAVYTLRQPDLIQALVSQAQAGVSVTVLLEGSPAGLSKSDPDWYQELWGCQQLAQAGGQCWFMVNDAATDRFDRYRYMHAKYLLIDRQQVLVTSQNLTEDGLPGEDRSDGTCGSRGLMLLTDAPSVVDRVAQVFEHDLDPAHHNDLLAWTAKDPLYGAPPVGYTPVLSATGCTTYTPVFSRPVAVAGTFDIELFTAPEAALRQQDALLGLLSRAGPGDEVYVEALDERAAWGPDPASDPSPRVQAYVAAARRGARVRVLLNGGSFDADYAITDENSATATYLNGIAHGERINLRAATGDPTRYGIHNKMILVWLQEEGGYVHLGSLNGSETASKANRELVLQVRSDAVYGFLKQVFVHDWAAAHPVFLPLLRRRWQPPAPAVPYVVVSEVLYDPPGAGEGEEWVELYNPTGQTVDLAGWYLGDVGPQGEYGSGLYRFPAGTTLPPGATLLVARQAADVVGFVPDLEFVIDPLRDDGAVPNMEPAGGWEGFGFALGNGGDEVLLLDTTGAAVDVLAYGAGSYPGVIAHPGVYAPGHSLERRPAIYDTDDCSRDFFDRYPPDPGAVDGVSPG